MSPDAGQSGGDDDTTVSAWKTAARMPPELRIVAAIPLPPPAVGSAAIMEGRLVEFFPRDPAVVSVSFLTAGDPVVEIRRAGRIERQQLRAGTFGVSPAGGGVALRTDRPHTSLNILMADEVLQEFARRELGHRGGRVDMVEGFGFRTPEILSLGQAFGRLVGSTRTGVALYAETLWTQIALQLLWHHSSIASAADHSPVTPLSHQRVAKVVAYLEENLASDTTLSDLATLVGLSPSHFLRAFKQATGQTPNRYRMELRAARACMLLRDPALPLTQIALSLGYSSHSHFSSSFRRCRGTTPSAYRDNLLRRDPG